MSKMSCPDCHKAISTSASSCPRCGWVNNLSGLEKLSAVERFRNANFIKFFLGFIAMLVLFFVIFFNLSNIVNYFSFHRFLFFRF